MTEPHNTDPTCALCLVHACCARPGTKTPPKFCPQPGAEELLQEIAERYHQDLPLRDLAIASARTEASGYMRRTRIEDTMGFARRIGATKLGIAHCIVFMHSQAPTTVLIAKDRVLGHNPVAALYTSSSHYRRLTEGEPADESLRRRMANWPPD